MPRSDRGALRGDRARRLGPAILSILLAVVAASTALGAFRPDPYLEPFDPRSDYRYDLATSAASVRSVELDAHTGAPSVSFAWPAGLDGDTALLEVEVVEARRGDPGVRARGGDIVVRQVFEDDAHGRRYLDLSPLLRASISGRVVLEPDGVRLRSGSAKLYVYRNATPTRATRVLVVAPHPDDAEIAAFGVYSSTDADVVTVTSGDAGEQGFKVLFPEPGEHYRMKGTIRAWDSITVPFFGGVAPGRARNLGYYDATLGRLWASRPGAVEPLYAALDRPGQYRELNVDPVLKERPFTGTWSGLVADLRAELERVDPKVVIAAHPLLDRHRDHRFATFALLQALESWPGDCELWLFTNHAVQNESWPFGPRDAMTGLPPWPGASAVRGAKGVPAEGVVNTTPGAGGTTPFASSDLYFSRVYSHPLDEAARDRKLVALEAMHDLRPFDLRDGSRPEPTARERAEDRRYDYFRRAARPNELFFVLTKSDASRLRAALYDRSKLWESLRYLDG